MRAVLRRIRVFHRPVWTLRTLVSVFYQTFYVSAMGLFLENINCHWLAPTDSKYKRGFMDKYQDHRKRPGVVM
ncbi:hypothetical protein GPECTOR_39g476 [Gonium pectorale]|uniref:Uncharacterized protein n=1 Tax=Gonium pectorale TaxID=33097 RepID=A0A150GAW7_GONPE|nr:hypothetical protein GPECTOR_39g476 [Gonium pectorale]|eukprot:KXZ46982.1 hypothetical protein GPECTOR_39g476 [Gonium pectorale]